jgi:alkylation response protein AidB-like acyl-CoA dehydrogenase
VLKGKGRIMAIALSSSLVLTDELLDGIAERADGYDRAGQFFSEDFAALRDIGYYRAPVPVALGGAGLTLGELAAAHRRIAYRSASTALASGMHLFWVGAAVDRVRAGDTRPEWILEAAAAGEIFAAGHSERGNDLALWGSTTEARPAGDGYAFYGRKLFTSLSPVWTILGVHGADTSGPDGQKIIHGFVSRDDPGVRTEETWDTVALRATRSDDTVLDGARSPAERIIAVLSPAASGSEYLDSVSAWAVVLTSSVYLAIAQRALDLAVQVSSGRVSNRLDGRPRSEDPFVQAVLGEAVAELDAIEAHLETAAREWTEQPVADIPWNRRLLAVKQHATLGAKRVVDSSLQVIGGRSLRRGSVIERLYRDVAAGVLHNPTPDTVLRALGSADFVSPDSFTR